MQALKENLRDPAVELAEQYPIREAFFQDKRDIRQKRKGLKTVKATGSRKKP